MGLVNFAGRSCVAKTEDVSLGGFRSVRSLLSVRGGCLRLLRDRDGHYGLMLFQQGIETPQQILYGFTPRHISSYWLEMDAKQDKYLAWWDLNYPSHPTTEEITGWVQTW